MKRNCKMAFKAAFEQAPGAIPTKTVLSYCFDIEESVLLLYTPVEGRIIKL